MSQDSALAAAVRAIAMLERRVQRLEAQPRRNAVSLTVLANVEQLPDTGLVVPGPIYDGVVTEAVVPGVDESLLTGLISYWKLDEASGTRADSVTASGNDLGDNSVTQAAGKVGNAGQFTATSTAFLNRADNASLSTGDIDFTVCAWVYLDSEPATTMVAVAKNLATGNQREHALYYNGADRFVFQVSNDGTAVVLVTANTFGAVATGTWYFLVAWHDSVANTINIQVNNGTADSTAHATGVFDSTAAFEIGRNGNAALYWDGRIDEVGFWKRVLTADERTRLYNAGAGKTHPFDYTPPSTMPTAESFIYTLGADARLLVI